jgi:beta-galactosidase
MKAKFLTPFLFVLLCIITQGCKKSNNITAIDSSLLDSVRKEILFDENWRFHLGDTAGAEMPEFDDSQWRLLDLPHDWSIEDLPGKDSPTDPNAVGGIDAGYLVGGTGWYRKEFKMPADLKGKQFMIQFDGIYMNSDVWINGVLLGNHPYGYTSFRYDISDKLLSGSNNVIAVRVKNEGRNSRWYSGSGIYRHVWLSITGQVHFDKWQTAVSATISDNSKAVVRVRPGFVNNQEKAVKLEIKIYLKDPSGKDAGSAASFIEINRKSSGYAIKDIEVDNPVLWSVEKPELYKAVSEVYLTDTIGNKTLMDRIETIFGIRSVEISAEKGFVLNGVPLELKGGCMHHDNGPLGAAAFDRAEERRVELMKASGFNAIRCSHNPPSPAFLDACDRIGMLVIDEAFDMWREQKNPQDYHLWFDEWWRKDIESMILRDRNHPSVIMWSIGNEVPERGKPEGAALAKEMVSFVKTLDPTRMVTSAVNSVTEDKDPYFSSLDVCGYNYAEDKYVSDHKRIPSRIMYGSESFPLEAYKYWMAAVDNKWVLGDFVWTGFDYLGESSIGWLGYPHEGSFYPWTHAFCGDIDICGFKRPQSYYRDVLWNDARSVSVFVKPPVPSFPLNPKKAQWSKWEWQDVVSSWNWEGSEGKILTVEVYSSCPETELFLNNKSLGRKKTDRSTEWIARWEVPYEPGVLSAKGYTGKDEAIIAELKTADKPAKIKLTADRQAIKADGQDLSYITVELLDNNGVRNPEADNLVNFSIEGPGTILSVGSSNPMGTESFKKPYRKAWQGRCLVVVRGGKVAGEIRLKAVSPGLEGDEILISSLNGAVNR